VRPRVEDTVLIAEQIRRFAMGAHRRIVQDSLRESLILAGKAGRDRPAEGHQHAYYLPWDRDGDGRIDHVIVHAAAGLDPEEVAALDRIRWPAQLNRDQPLAVLPITAGTRDSVFEGSRRFRSATPFVPTRHYRPTRDGEHGKWLAGQLTLELVRHRKGALASPPLHLLNDGRSIGRARRWLEYRRSRKCDAPKLGYGFRIELAQATHGPFSIGYGAHFGLGLFVPETE
jgi:CRISPR-associated protein Csb2